MNIQTFSFANQSLQIIIKDNQAWFIASEVANLLGYRDAHNLTRILDDDETGTHNMSIRSENGTEQNRAVSIINESGFYHAAFKSRKPEVKPFRKWVTSEVLPQIRKTGSYTLKVSAQQKQQIQAAVNRRVHRTGETHQAIYNAIHELAQVASYHDIAATNFNRVMNFINAEKVSDSHKNTLPLDTHLACHFIKLLNYARCYQRFQNLLCGDPNSPEAKKLLNYFQYSVNVNQTGFLFVFKPDIENDIQTASNFIHQYFQDYDLQMI